MTHMAAYSILLFLVVWLGPLPALAQRESRYEKFHRQHVDYPKTSSHLDARHYCNLMMQRRGMTSTSCKPSNTFIHASRTQVDSTCTYGGIFYNENYYDSTAYFDLTTCRISGGSQRPPCNYRGRLGTQRIRVACVNGVPVHFKEYL